MRDDFIIDERVTDGNLYQLVMLDPRDIARYVIMKGSVKKPCNLLPMKYFRNLEAAAHMFNVLTSEMGGLPEVVLIEKTKCRNGSTAALLVRPAVTRPVGRYIATRELDPGTDLSPEWHNGNYFDRIDNAVSEYRRFIWESGGPDDEKEKRK